MSYYYNYYIGYESNGKIYPLGPYDCFGNLRKVISRSRNFASDLHYDFSKVPEKKISDELRKEFEYEDYNGKKTCEVKYLYMSNLPSSDYMKSGYFLIEDVQRYEEFKRDGIGVYDFDGFYDWLEPLVYIGKLQNEKQLGAPTVKKNDFGEEYIPKSAADYMYYMYPDYESKEYEVSLLLQAISSLDLDSYKVENKINEDARLVVLETEG